jgi:hypothetical protein
MRLTRRAEVALAFGVPALALFGYLVFLALGL